jgi:hypothetical protein
VISEPKARVETSESRGYEKQDIYERNARYEQVREQNVQGAINRWMEIEGSSQLVMFRKQNVGKTQSDERMNNDLKNRNIEHHRKDEQGKNLEKNSPEF